MVVDSPAAPVGSDEVGSDVGPDGEADGGEDSVCDVVGPAEADPGAGDPDGADPGAADPEGAVSAGLRR